MYIPKQKKHNLYQHHVLKIQSLTHFHHKKQTPDGKNEDLSKTQHGKTVKLKKDLIR